MALANELGFAGEKAAQRYLLSRRPLLIVEVKSRMEYTATTPLDAINVAKAHQMMLGGMRYAQRLHIDLPIRYDVVEALYCPASDVFELKYHKGYFSAEEIALQEALPHGSIQP